MIKFDFKLRLGEQFIREKIDLLMDYDNRKADKSVLSWSPDYDEGIHFTENTEKICGFYQNIDQFKQTGRAKRGTPLRTRFRGRLIKQPDGSTCFKGTIYPDFSAMILAITVFIVFVFVSKDPGAILMSGLVIIVFALSHIKLAKELYHALEQFFT